MTLSRKKLSAVKEVLIFIFLLLLAVLLCVEKQYSVSILYGIELWFACLLPTLFPYFFITYAISSLKVTKTIFYKLSPLTKKLFNLSGFSGYAFILSIISGYPVGAKTVSDLYINHQIDTAEAERALAICSTSSPTFLIASIGSITFNDTIFGLFLFLCHLLSAFLTGIIFSFYKRKEKPKNLLAQTNANESGNLLGDGIYSSIISVLTVGGTIALFSLFTDVLINLNIFYPLSKLLNLITKNQNLTDGLILGTLECTRGLKVLSGAGITFFSLPLCAAICGFGGLSVIMQTFAFAKKAKIKTAPFILAKITSAVINFIIGLIFSIIFF